MESRPRVRRRRYLRLAGAATLTALAGCGGDGGDDDGGDGGGAALSGEDYPAVDEWLTETDIGAAAPNYDGSIVDERDRDTATVEVGTGDTGTEFGPAAVAVSSGTTVRWEWTGEGGAHNVEAVPDEQIGESDYEFSSGDPVDDEGETYEQTLDESGIALYHCEPHLSVGMKGAVVVE
jgi:halocyanin-like protein